MSNFVYKFCVENEAIGEFMKSHKLEGLLNSALVVDKNENTEDKFEDVNIMINICSDKRVVVCDGDLITSNTHLSTYAEGYMYLIAVVQNTLREKFSDNLDKVVPHSQLHISPIVIGDIKSERYLVFNLVLEDDKLEVLVGDRPLTNIVAFSDVLDTYGLNTVTYRLDYILGGSVLCPKKSK